MKIEPTNDVDSSKWNDMDYDELLGQKKILSNRYNSVISINPEIAKSLLEGIEKLDNIIQSKIKGE